MNKIKIDTLILSDLHLGLQFGQAKKCLSVLDKYDFNRLIINGDLLHYRDARKLSSVDWRMLDKIIEIKKNKSLILVHGNHDGDKTVIKDLIDIDTYDYFEWTFNDKKYLAIHGHQFDTIFVDNKFWEVVGNFYSYFKILIRKQFVIEFLKKVNSSWKKMVVDVRRGAINFANEKQSDVVFCGHTHVSGHAKEDKICYYNSGSWAENMYAYIIVSDDGIELYEEK